MPTATIVPAAGDSAVTDPLLPTALAPAAFATGPPRLIPASAVARSVRPISLGRTAVPVGHREAPPVPSAPTVSLILSVLSSSIGAVLELA